MVDASQVGGGSDLPESGMDAIMQAIVCKGVCMVLVIFIKWECIITGS